MTDPPRGLSVAFDHDGFSANWSATPSGGRWALISLMLVICAPLTWAVTKRWKCVSTRLVCDSAAVVVTDSNGHHDHLQRDQVQHMACDAGVVLVFHSGGVLQIPTVSALPEPHADWRSRSAFQRRTAAESCHASVVGTDR